MKKNKLFILLTLILSTSVASANQWVHGKVSMLEEYGSYDGSNYEVLITLTDKLWKHGVSQDGQTNCTHRFRVKLGKEGVDENIKNRIFSLMLTAFTANKNVALYVNTSTGPYCNVQIGRIYNP